MEQSHTRKSLAQPLSVLALLVGLAFSPCLGAGFVNWDDPVHITDNAQVKLQSLQNLKEIFTRTVNKTYIPLTTLSFNLEYGIVGERPLLYHADNVLLHIGVTLLVFLLAMRLGLAAPAAFWAALLFGIHPVHVESVAWVTQRKDVLYSFLYLLAILAYLRYSLDRDMRFYLLALLLGVASILAKPMAMSLPWILLLIDWLRGRKLTGRDVWVEKFPFLIVIEAVALITYSLHARVLALLWPRSAVIWLWTFAFPLWKFFWPRSLAVFYSLPDPLTFSQPLYWAAALTLLALVLIVALGRSRLLKFAVLFYAGSSFFMWRYDITDLNLVADRYMYLPSLGLCLLLGQGIYRLSLTLASSRARRIRYLLLLAAVFGALMARTVARCADWQDGTRLWQTALSLSADHPLLLLNTGNSLARKGDYDRALDYYDRALKVLPGYVEAHDKRGVIFAEVKNEPDLALAEFDRALLTDPRYAPAYYHKGNVFLSRQEYGEALKNYDQAIRFDPFLAEAYINRGHIQATYRQDYEAALRDLNRAIDLDQGFAVAYVNRGMVYRQLGQDALAEEDFERARRLESGEER